MNKEEVELFKQELIASCGGITMRPTKEYLMDHTVRVNKAIRLIDSLMAKNKKLSRLLDG